jgi:hypothetical protein
LCPGTVLKKHLQLFALEIYMRKITGKIFLVTVNNLKLYFYLTPQLGLALSYCFKNKKGFSCIDLAREIYHEKFDRTISEYDPKQTQAASTGALLISKIKAQMTIESNRQLSNDDFDIFRTIIDPTKEHKIIQIIPKAKLISSGEANRDDLTNINYGNILSQEFLKKNIKRTRKQVYKESKSIQKKIRNQKTGNRKLEVSTIYFYDYDKRGFSSLRFSNATRNENKY